MFSHISSFQRGRLILVPLKRHEQKRLVAEVYESASQKKGGGGVKLAYRSPLLDSIKVRVLCTRYDLFKIDMDKVYDWFSWGFIKAILNSSN